MTPVDGVCVACESPCITCEGTPTQCTACIAGYQLNPVTKKCTKIVDCPNGYYASQFGGCKHICGEGEYYHDFACYVGKCPIGFVIDDESRSCKQQDTPSGCSFPYFFQDDRCVTA